MYEAALVEFGAGLAVKYVALLRAATRGAAAVGFEATAGRAAGRGAFLLGAGRRTAVSGDVVAVVARFAGGRLDDTVAAAGLRRDGGGEFHERADCQRTGRFLALVVDAGFAGANIAVNRDRARTHGLGLKLALVTLLHGIEKAAQHVHGRRTVGDGRRPQRRIELRRCRWQRRIDDDRMQIENVDAGRRGGMDWRRQVGRVRCG